MSNLSSVKVEPIEVSSVGVSSSGIWLKSHLSMIDYSIAREGKGGRR